MFLLVPAYSGCPGSKAVKWSLLLLLLLIIAKCGIGGRKPACLNTAGFVQSFQTNTVL